MRRKKPGQGSSPSGHPNVQTFRASLGLTRSDFARQIGVTPATVYRWEKGQSSPSPLAAKKLDALGFRDSQSDLFPTTDISAPRQPETSGKPGHRRSQRPPNFQSGLKIQLPDGQFPILPSPWVQNGPADQAAFHKRMIEIQGTRASTLSSPLLARRLSMVQGVAEFGPTAQSLLEAPKPTAKAWNSNYGPHGWHRYVGRFPPHVVRALLNHFQASSSTPVCDPFVGSGTSAVECRLLGIPFIGIEICPLSSLITRTKSTFPEAGQPLRDLATRYARFYKDQWATYSTRRKGTFIHSSVLKRSGNPIPEFPNHDKWFTPEALLGTSLTVEYAMSQTGFLRSALLLALSAKMRSIGNVDVDVVRAEYRRQPRTNVDVCKLVVAQLNKMARDIDATTASHDGLIGSPDMISLHEASVLDVTLAPRSIEFVITSPPYGVEVISYLRTHLLSYRALVAELDHDPYDTRDKTIGSEYVPNEMARQIKRVERCSQTFAAFFAHLANLQDASLEPRRLAMMHFFDDMLSVGERLREWLVPNGKIAFIIGNKKLGTEVIPAQDIIRELFDACGLSFRDAVTHKLKTNNSNSQVPWQDRIIQDEAIMLFERRP